MNQTRNTALSMELSSHDFRRSAISLNNIGVSLLERKYFHEAVKTLKDALLLMRTSTITSSTPDDDFILRDTSLHKGYLRLSKAKPSPTCVQNIHFTSFSTSGAVWMSAMEHESLMGANKQLVAFRIEEYDTNDSSEIIAAIILNTLAIAYLCLSEMEKRSSIQEGRYVERAVRLLRISYAILHGSASEVLGMNLLLSFLQYTVLNTLVSILNVQNRVGEARAYDSILRFLKQKLALSRNTFDTANKGAAAA